MTSKTDHISINQSRYHGSYQRQDHGPYTRSSSSSGQRWEELVWRMAITDTTVARTVLQEKFTDTTVDINFSFLLQSLLYPIQRLFELH